MAEPPPDLWSRVPHPLPPASPLGSDGVSARRQTSTVLRGTRAATVLLFLLLLVSGTSFALGNLTNLGRADNALPPYLPLGGFHRIPTTLRQQGKLEFLFIGTQVDAYSAVERWPVVKALDQFGTLAGVRASTARACGFTRAGKLDCTTPPFPGWRDYATFDWSHASYRSRYLNFVHKDLIYRSLNAGQALSPQETELFNTYARVSGYPKWNDAVWHTAVGDTRQPGRLMPVLVVGNYLQTGVNVATAGDMTARGSNINVPFRTVQDSLRTGKTIGEAPSTLVPDFNAEANVITALICHADGLQPAKVCGRPVIKGILKHVSGPAARPVGVRERAEIPMHSPATSNVRLFIVKTATLRHAAVEETP
jgi:hypothetical protein